MIWADSSGNSSDPFENHKEIFAQMSLKEIEQELDGMAGMMGVLAMAAQDEGSKEINVLAGALCDLTIIVSILVKRESEK
jgi:hypothetical protein